MKINEVERQVGITKKNIRFYEDQGLISPERNLSNGYREYSERDVLLLLKIKLLRRLAIPIEEIRKLLEGRLTLLECMERHQIYLRHEKHNLELISEMCEKLSQEEKTLSGLEADRYLEQLNEMEKECTIYENFKGRCEQKEAGSPDIGYCDDRSHCSVGSDYFYHRNLCPDSLAGNASDDPAHHGDYYRNPACASGKNERD